MTLQKKLDAQLPASSVLALHHARVFILQTIKCLFGGNTHGAHDPCLNRIYQFHDHQGLPFRLLVQERLRKNKIG